MLVLAILDVLLMVAFSYASSVPTATPAEAAARLGVSESTIRRWARSGALEAVRVGGRLRIEPDALDTVVRPAHEEERDDGR